MDVLLNQLILHQLLLDLLPIYQHHQEHSISYLKVSNYYLLPYDQNDLGWFYWLRKFLLLLDLDTNQNQNMATVKILDDANFHYHSNHTINQNNLYWYLLPTIFLNI